MAEIHKKKKKKKVETNHELYSSLSDELFKVKKKSDRNKIKILTPWGGQQDTKKSIMMTIILTRK